MKITRLELTNWLNFKKVDVELGERVFIFGANAAGKSNFLDVFRFLRAVAEEGGGLQSAVKDRGSFSTIRTLHATGRNQDVCIDLGCRDAAGVDWRYRLLLEASDDHSALVKEELVTRSDQPAPVLSRPDDADRADPPRRRQTHLEQVNSNAHFRELAELFRSIRYVHLVPQLLRDPERYIRFTDDPYGADFLGGIAQTPKKQRDARLGRIQKALKRALPQFEELRFAQDEKGRPHLEAKYLHWRKKGAWQNETQFSDGTIRLIGLLWELSGPGGPLLLEEPEMSLHAAVVRQLPRVFARVMSKHGRQVFCSTHSEQLFDDGGIDPSDVLVLEATKNETTITQATKIPQVKALASAGAPYGEVLVARTRPEGIEQLSMFGG